MKPYRKALAYLLACCLLALAFLPAACTSRNAAPVIKLGVIAPFEGPGRPLGYAILPAVKEAVREANNRNALGPYRVAVVAFNDDLDPATAADQARALALDSDVLAVIGPFTPETAAAAAPILAAAGVAHLAINAPDPTATDHSAAIAGTQKAASALIEALTAATQSQLLTRPAVTAALSTQ
jgi:ABC-type branched-subunit amino acid transport system substrate-binding protein